MTEEQITEEQVTEQDTEGYDIDLRVRLQIDTRTMSLQTVGFGIVGALFYVVISMIPMPYVMVSILKFSLLPAVVIIALVGAIKGPLAGFISGYLGEILYGLYMYNHIVTMTLPAMAFGVLGLIVGLTTYDFSNGRSLAKLSGLSAIGFVFTTLLVVVIGIIVEVFSVLVAIAFLMLPLLTTGLPTLIFVTPVVARILHELSSIMTQSESSE